MKKIISGACSAVAGAVLSFSSAMAACYVNGKEVPCEEVGRGLATFFGLGFAAFVVVFIFILALWVFWLWMLVHAIKHPIEYKPLWILVLLLASVLGAIVYYFAVKRPLDKAGNYPVATDSGQGGPMPR